MADTGIIGPVANVAIGTALGDGTNYGSFSNPQRLYRTAGGSSAATVTTSGKGTLWYNCFVSEIPSSATIQGIEIVAGVDFDGSGNSNIGNFGSTGTTETITMQMYLYNGTSYSSALQFDGIARTGISYANNNTEITFTGANRRYLGLSTLGTLVGGASDLSGLAWDPTNQADFGFALTTIGVTATPVSGIIRGIGLKAHYTTATPTRLLNYSGSQITEIDKVPGQTIAKWGAIDFTAAAPPSTTWSSSLYSYENQTTQESATGNWVVSTPMSDAPAWGNGSSVVNGTYWGLTSNKTVKGWNLGQDSTPSSNTGPAGGATFPNGTPSTLTGEHKYMYTEATSGRNNYCFVCRTGGYNFSTLMNDTSNDLELQFYVHGFGSQMGDLFIYIDTATTSNNTNATLLDSITTFTQTATTSNYTLKMCDLNNYRAINDTHYIYFVSQNGTGFRSDLAVDLVQIKELTP